MPGKNYKSLTVNKKVYDRFDLTSEKVSYLLKLSLEEKEKLQKIALKIKKYPETMRVYTVPWMTKKSGE